MKNLFIIFYIVIFTCISGCAPIHKNILQDSDVLHITETKIGVEILLTDSVFFDSGKYDIKPNSHHLLDKIAFLLKYRTNNQILVEGHTDNEGNSVMNKELSELRALNVVKELVKRGVNKNRFNYIGYGDTKPIRSNSTKQGRAYNRRTNIIILNETIANLNRKR